MADIPAEYDEKQDRACLLVGRFIYHFAKIESALDEGVRKLKELEPDRAQIVTANIDFFKKLSIVRSAIELQSRDKPEAWKKAAEQTFNSVARENDARQTVAHSSFEPNPANGVKFNRTVARTKLDKQNPVWTEEIFAGHFGKMKQLRTELRDLVREIAPYKPSLDFSDPRNSGYLVLFQSVWNGR